MLSLGVSTWNVDGLCNSLGGLYALTVDGTAAFAGTTTAMYCVNSPTMQAEEQIDAVIEPNRGLFEVSVDGDTMTWNGVTEGALVWRRTGP